MLGQYLPKKVTIGHRPSTNNSGAIFTFFFSAILSVRVKVINKRCFVHSIYLSGCFLWFIAQNSCIVWYKLAVCFAACSSATFYALRNDFTKKHVRFMFSERWGFFQCPVYGSKELPFGFLPSLSFPNQRVWSSQCPLCAIKSYCIMKKGWDNNDF